MKSFKHFLKEAVPTNSANAAGNPTGNPATNAGYGAHAAAQDLIKDYFQNLLMIYLKIIRLLQNQV